jgi:hypothetical protein
MKDKGIEAQPVIRYLGLLLDLFGYTGSNFGNQFSILCSIEIIFQ